MAISLGDVVLERVSIKKQALEKLKLPIDVKQGFSSLPLRLGFICINRDLGFKDFWGAWF